jgi:hypothetical protein
MAKYTFIAAAWTKGASAFTIQNLPLEAGKVYEATKPAEQVANRILQSNLTALGRLKYGLLFFIQGEDGNVKGYRVKGPLNRSRSIGVGSSNIQEIKEYPNDNVKGLAQSIADTVAHKAKAIKSYGELLSAVYMQEEHKASMVKVPGV